MSDNPEMPPHEIQVEWIRFIETKPTVPEMVDWCVLKAAEIGWNDLDLSEALFFGVAKPDLPEPPDPEQGPTN